MARRNALTKHGFLPQIRIHEVQIEGPLPQSPQVESVERLIGGADFSPERVPTLLEQFVARAFRRPAREEDVEKYVSLYEKRVQGGREDLDAYKDALLSLIHI